MNITKITTKINKDTKMQILSKWNSHINDCDLDEDFLSEGPNWSWVQTRKTSYINKIPVSALDKNMSNNLNKNAKCKVTDSSSLTPKRQLPNMKREISLILRSMAEHKRRSLEDQECMSPLNITDSEDAYYLSIKDITSPLSINKHQHSEGSGTHPHNQWEGDQTLTLFTFMDS